MRRMKVCCWFLDADCANNKVNSDCFEISKTKKVYFRRWTSRLWGLDYAQVVFGPEEYCLVCFYGNWHFCHKKIYIMSEHVVPQMRYQLHEISLAFAILGFVETRTMARGILLAGTIVARCEEWTSNLCRKFHDGRVWNFLFYFIIEAFMGHFTLVGITNVWEKSVVWVL